MDMYPQYKSPLGYSTGDNKIDAYGVDHSGFSTRDELEYQFARQNKENQLIQNYNNQGITQNYPQQGTNFWGTSPDNNYGFGTSKIHNNIENMQNQTNNFGNSNNTQWGMNNEQPNNINSGYGQTNTQPQTYNIFGNNNALQNTPNLAQGLNFGASAALYPQQNSFSTYSQPYQLAQNTNPNTVSDTGSNNIEDRGKLEYKKPNTYVGYSRYNHDCSVQGVFDNFLKMRKDTAVEKPISSGVPATDYALNRIPIIGKYIKAYNLSSQACSTLAQALNAYHESCQTVNKK